MTVKPEDCLKLTENEIKIVSDMEKAIDLQLREQFVLPSSRVRVSLSFVLNERIFNKIFSMYNQCGWDVVQATSGGDDPRGTCPVVHYIEFTKTKETYSGRDFRDNTGNQWDR